MSRVAAYIAARKVEGLRQARDELHAAYDALEREVAAEASPRAALRRLVTGLRAVEVGGRPAHADLPALDAVADGGDDHLVATWTASLRRRVAHGRARADLLPLVAGVLGEASRPGRRVPAADPAVVAGELEAWCTPATYPGPLVAEALGAAGEDVRVRVRAEVARRVADAAEEPPEVGVEAALLRDDERAEATRWSGRADPDGTDPELRDLRGALRLRWRDVLAWDHEGPAQWASTWTRTRWRLRPGLDWLGAWTVEAVGEVIGGLAPTFDGVGHVNRRLRLERLEELKAPDVILENERRLLAATHDLFGRFGPDSGFGPPASVRRARLGAARFSADAAYDGYGGSEIARATARLGAEVTLARAHGRPLWVVKSDLADFYPSVSHDLVRELLAGVGLPDPWVDLVIRCLSVPLPDGRRTARGLPLGWTLSRVLGDLLVGVMVGRVRASAPEVEVLTLVDDVWFLAPDRGSAARAWAAWVSGAEAAGLAVNARKSGSVVVGASGPGPGPSLGPGLLPAESRATSTDGELRSLIVGESGSRSDRRPGPGPSLGPGLLPAESRATSTDGELRSLIVGESGSRSDRRPGPGPSLGPGLLPAESRATSTDGELRSLIVGESGSRSDRRPGPVAGAVTWGLLRLDEDGSVGVDDAALAAFTARTRDRLSATDAVLDRVDVLRDQLAWAVAWLAPAARVGPPGVHLARVRAALEAWWSALGVEASLLDDVSGRFLGGARARVPAAWLHWPVTAGGLGVPWWPAELAGRPAGGEAPPAPTPEAETDPRWGRWFAERLVTAAVEAPATSPEVQGWLDRFVARGEALGRPPTPLAPYWQWVLTSHGESIVEAFGTWDFVPVDLVPAELLRGR